MPAVKSRGMPGNLVTPAEWATATGYHVRHAYYLMERGVLPYLKYHGYKRILVDEIDDPAYQIERDKLREIQDTRARN